MRGRGWVIGMAAALATVAAQAQTDGTGASNTTGSRIDNSNASSSDVGGSLNNPVPDNNGPGGSGLVGPQQTTENRQQNTNLGGIGESGGYGYGNARGSDAAGPAGDGANAAGINGGTDVGNSTSTNSSGTTSGTSGR